MVMMSMLGGLGTVAGPVIGATIIYWLRDIVWANLGDYHLMAQGVVLITLVLFVPNGITGLFDRKSALMSLLSGKSSTQKEAYHRTH